MRKKLTTYVKLIGLAAALPFIYGCGSGGGVGALTGFLFGSGGGGVGDIVLLGGGGIVGGGGGGLATLSQPEPASMLLVGGGLMAMSYFRSKTHRRDK